MSIIDCSNCPIDGWIHGCHLTAEECEIITVILETSLDRIAKEYFKENLAVYPSLDGKGKEEET